MKLYIDDFRPTPKGFDLRAYNSQSAICFLELYPIDFISFDHDLGGEDTAYVVAKFIEERASRGIKPPDYTVHSSNPAGAFRIRAAMESAKRLHEKETS
jgi:hypothetical protein